MTISYNLYDIKVNTLEDDIGFLYIVKGYEAYSETAAIRLHVAPSVKDERVYAIAMKSLLQEYK